MIQKVTLPPVALFENGDRLTREEFHRLYELMPGVKKAELIRGVVYMPSPLRIDWHGTPHGMMINWLGHYFAYTPGVNFADNTTVILSEDSEVQPDGLLRDAMPQGGRLTVRTQNVTLDSAFCADHPQIEPGEYISISVTPHDEMAARNASLFVRASGWGRDDESSARRWPRALFVARPMVPLLDDRIVSTLSLMLDPPEAGR